jgi:hypothetical protein
MAIHIDLRKNRGARYCPLMKEMCSKGWTRSMGEDAKTGDRPSCAAWQPVTIYDPAQKINETIYDCSEFGWPADLLTEVSKEAYQTAASVDKVASQINRRRAEIIGALPEEVKERLIESDVNVLDSSAPK